MSEQLVTRASFNASMGKSSSQGRAHLDKELLLVLEGKAPEAHSVEVDRMECDLHMINLFNWTNFA